MAKQTLFPGLGWLPNVLLAALTGLCSVSLVNPLAGAADIDFAKDIQMVLARRCYACHGPDLQEGSIRFDDRTSLIAEADSGLPPLTPGKASQSELIRRITTEDESERMPPEGKPLTETEVAALAAWIDSGAEYKLHWAFQPISRPPVPEVSTPAWSRQPLDNFILSKIEQAGLAPVAEASAQSLVRRTYIDITGLPPTPEQVAAWSHDWSDQKYTQLVDQLLADPAFGERWARNWLDVVRFAETNSYERDGIKPNAWKYRDYVIRAMNSDKPYDRFVREQLAGDELDEVTPDSLTATGYYRLGIWDDEPADPLQAKFDGYDDLVATTSQGFLGLTLNCARCHDHKIDPLLQKDYYSMVAFMRDVTEYAERGDLTTNNQIDINADVGEQYDVLESRKRTMEQETRKIEQAAIQKMTATEQRATEGAGRRQVLKERMQQFVDAETWDTYQSLKQEVREIGKQLQNLPPRETVLGLAVLNAHPEQTFVQLRGSPHAPGDPVDLTFPKLIGGGAPQIPEPPADAKSAGRRRVLADWIASDDNWMTARVIVNRIWLHYFGRGIVRSPNNFGLMGDPPTHPELLDFLATELIRNNWQLKNIHRMILQSSTYRLRTQPTDELEAQDPGNDLFCHQNLRRLSAEQIRDSVLTVTGQLNAVRFGESMYPELSAEVLASQSQPGKGWGQSSAAEQSRRSIYVHVKRSLPVPMLSAFDFPETDISCEARFLTTQPGQALSMLNSDWMQQQAEYFLKRVEAEVGNDLRQQAKRCLELALSKPAQEIDVAELLDLVARLKTQYELDDHAARHAMCLVTLNLNEFFYLD
ncbi:PSD1 and planctomycete cytochrome C domain-containing protein [Aureliella helgolandensis]|uniref:Planctomycete cytochrome C n=1 Tax=Aureliella helgolandensis TaxID=2527968 RepID=A0A518G042_9BACT|nr:PSD1 and planctomycete cytochrome C domain-containing protein [Aureliella helgolandensis]QDV21936.1 Planctomycete cytochrome C [Aureliella helgolandensis]